MMTPPELGRAPGSERRPKKFHRILLLLVVIGIAFHTPSAFSPPNWVGGDYAQYLMHAANLVEGRAFEDTPYIYNPDYPSLGPRAYPPGWPVLMAPILGAFDHDVLPVRLLSLCFFGGCLLLFGLLAQRHLPDPVALAAVALFGLNPQLHDIAAGLGSDVPFVFFLLASLLIVRGREGSPSWRRGLAIGALFYAAYAVRTVGGLLVPALLLTDLVEQRRIRTDTMVAVAFFAGLVLLQGVWTAGSGSYLDQLRPSGAVMLTNAMGYARAYASFWESGLERLIVFERIREIFTVISAILVGLGFYRNVRRGPTVLEFITPLYLGLIVIWPAFQGARFVVPILPLLLLYMLVGATSFKQGRLRRFCFAVAVGVPFLLYGTTVLNGRDVPQDLLVSNASSLELFAFVEQTPPDAVFVLARPRILAHATSRRAAAFHEPRRDDELFAFLARINADFLVDGPSSLEEGEPAEYLHGLLARNPESFSVAFSNGLFRVYRIVD